MNSKLSLKVPPYQGVSSGPKMAAFQTMMLSAEGAAVIPGVGSLASFFMSRMRRRRAAEDI